MEGGTEGAKRRPEDGAAALTARSPASPAAETHAGLRALEGRIGRLVEGKMGNMTINPHDRVTRAQEEIAATIASAVPAMSRAEALDMARRLIAALRQ